MPTPRRRRKEQERLDNPAGPIAVGPGHDDVARRAYELYEQRGRADHRDWDDWFQAERELLARTGGGDAAV